MSFELSSQSDISTFSPFHLSSPKQPSSLLPPAAPGFTRPPLCAEEAALRRALEHADGDHSTLIQVYEAFIQSEWPSLHPLIESQIFQRGSGVQPADRSLCPGRGGPLAKG